MQPAFLPLKKEHIKSIIVTSNNDFKAKAVGMLNNVAFIAEKVGMAEADAIRSAMVSDAKLRNVVIDCTCKEGRDFLGDPALVDLIKKTNAFVLAYFETKSDPMLSLDHVKAMPNFQHHPLPQQKEHYVAIFHTRKPTSGMAKPAPTAAAAPKAGNVFIEATNHVKSSFDQLQVCLKDRKNLVALEAVGQRFNGVFGTYSFFGDREGFRELSQLSTVIDDICRTYQPGSLPEITEPHAQLLLDAARCSFLMLKELREDRPLAAAQKAEVVRITTLHTKDATISKRASQAQGDIDSMIEDLMKKHAG